MGKLVRISAVYFILAMCSLPNQFVAAADSDYITPEKQKHVLPLPPIQDAVVKLKLDGGEITLKSTAYKNLMPSMSPNTEGLRVSAELDGVSSESAKKRNFKFKRLWLISGTIIWTSDILSEKTVNALNTTLTSNTNNTDVYAEICDKTGKSYYLKTTIAKTSVVY
jgi:hypothetical protein